MKKRLALAVLLGIASMSFGQGYVSFANTSTTRVSNDGLLQAAAPVGSYYYELIVAPQGTLSVPNNLSGWTGVALGTNTAIAGRMFGNNVDSSAAVQVAGYAPGTTAAFAVVGWSANLGSTYADVLAWWNGGYGSYVPSYPALFGISAVAPAVGLAPFGDPYNNVWGGIQGMNLYSVAVAPEPGTLALAALGAATLLRFRRRQ